MVSVVSQMSHATCIFWMAFATHFELEIKINFSSPPSLSLSPPPKTPPLVLKQSFLSMSPISLSCFTCGSLSFSIYQLLIWNFPAKTTTTGHHHYPYFIFRGILNTSPQLIWFNLCLISVILILLNVMVLN